MSELGITPEQRLKLLVQEQEIIIERLTRQLDAARQVERNVQKAREAEFARATAAEAERDALREALTRIVTMTYHAAWAPATGERWLDHIDETARAALGEAGALR